MKGRTWAAWLLWTGAAVMAVKALHHGPHWVRVVPGLLALFVAADVGERLGAWLGVLVALPASMWVVAYAPPTFHQRWSVVLLTVVMAGSVGAIGWVRRLMPLAGGSWMLGLVTAGGIYACVPETGHVQQVAIALGVALLAAEADAQRAPGVEQRGMVGAQGLMVGLLGWAVMYGGTYRDSAVIGGAGCFGLLVVAPLVALVPPPTWGRHVGPWMRTAALVGLQGAAALVVSRSAGLAHTWGGAVVLAVPELVVLVVLAASVPRVAGSSLH